jgi:hypothetical protein
MTPIYTPIFPRKPYFRRARRFLTGEGWAALITILGVIVGVIWRLSI